ncbi:MAG: carboxypeptidase-like regulatory domain-containing protein [Planctomycetaceae bacterium]|jgi:hypothetical protein|nr:carboxypeptidase-like regulatory domain-containing protein [Planctomycetaceae bacterium]
MNRKFLCLLVCAVVFALSGCQQGKGLKTEFVTGVVTLDGTPLPGATITFSPVSEGEMASGFSDDNGSYKLSSSNGDPEKGALAGEYVVTISKVEVKNYEENDPKAPKDLLTGRGIRSSQKELIPNKYRSASTSPLKVEVKKGKNTIDLAVVTK